MYEQHEKKYSAQLMRKGNFSLSNAAKGSQNVIPNFQNNISQNCHYFAIQTQKSVLGHSNILSVVFKSVLSLIYKGFFL